MYPPSSYATALPEIPDAHGMTALADRVFPQVFRHDFTRPGFVLLGLGPSVDSSQLRRFMVTLKELLSERYWREYGKQLAYLSMGRFDQQNTTKFHLDGAPDEAFLMLGYEPSEVSSELAMADYSRAAFDLGISPRQFLTDFNPMFRHGEQLLAPYVTRLTAFDPAMSQVLLVNNSSAPFDNAARHQQGVMHQATIPSVKSAAQRVVNSTMLAAVIPDAGEVIPKPLQTLFITTTDVSGPVQYTS